MGSDHQSRRGQHLAYGAGLHEPVAEFGLRATGPTSTVAQSGADETSIDPSLVLYVTSLHVHPAREVANG